MNSDLKTYPTGEVYNALPAELQAVIVDKYNFLESRYSSSGDLEDSTNYWNRKNMGKVWAPTEYEVFGSAIWGTKSRSEGCGIQYPLFRSYTGRTRYYYDSSGDHSLNRAYWWTASACGGSSEDAVYVNNNGYANNNNADNENCAPL